jgi:hypothetical protein
MSDAEWLSRISRLEGESLEQYEARIRFLRRISDWSDPVNIQITRKPVIPAAKLRRRKFKLPWSRPKR